MKYFRIKRPAPTFEYVVHVATQASLDKIIEINTLKYNRLVMTSEEFPKDDYVLTGDADHLFNRAIKWINSLYTETFVIESEGCIKKVKREARGVLSNGNEFTVWRASCGESCMLTIMFDGSRLKNDYSLDILKGATIIQKRGDV